MIKHNIDPIPCFWMLLIASLSLVLIVIAWSGSNLAHTWKPVLVLAVCIGIAAYFALQKDDSA